MAQRGDGLVAKVGQAGLRPAACERAKEHAK